jgi:hypothetical protein
MADTGRKKLRVGSGVVLKVGDGGSPEQFHPLGELIDFGTPGLKSALNDPNKLNLPEVYPQEN